MHPPRLLITGASGYLGGRILQLAPADWELHATYHTHPLPAPYRSYRLDLTDGQAVAVLVERLRPSTIIHTAAANPGSGLDMAAVNIYGTRHIARTAAARGARLIHLSTDVIFAGDAAPYTEEARPNPITPYGRSKAAAEAELWAAGAEAVSVRTSLIYGWRPTLDRQSRWIIHSLQNGEPLRLFTNEIRCPIWVDTLAEAVLELVTHTYTGALNIAGAQRLSRYDFGCRLARFYGLDPVPIIAADSRANGYQRPEDCTLDCTRARTLLRTPLPGVDEILAIHGTDPCHPSRFGL